MDIELPEVLPKRGLDPDQVNIAINGVQAEIERLEFERAQIDNQVNDLTREIAEVRSAIKRASSKPSFSDLGAAFEQTLRVAEEQAAKLLADAQASSAQIRRAADDEANELTENAQKQAIKLMADAEDRATRLINESEKKLNDALRLAQQQLETAQTQHAEAQELAVVIAAEGEQARLQLETDLAAEVDQSRAEIATLKQLHERDQRRINDEIDLARQKAERESTRLAAENEMYIRQLTEDSEKQLDEARDRAREILVEAQRNFAETRQEGVALVRDARDRAAGIVRLARVRAQALNERLDERNTLLLEESEGIVDDLSFEREAVEAFNSELRIISMSERMAEESEEENFESEQIADQYLVESLDMVDDEPQVSDEDRFDTPENTSEKGQ